MHLAPKETKVKVTFFICKLTLKPNSCYLHEPPAGTKDSSNSVWDSKESQEMSWKHHEVKTILHFIDGETEAERGNKLCPRSCCVSVPAVSSSLFHDRQQRSDLTPTNISLKMTDGLSGI